MEEITKDSLPQAAERGVFCFGGGQGLRTFAFVLRRMGLLSRVEAVVDNDASSWGKRVEVEGATIPVISPAELCRRIHGQAIIISCKAEAAIRAQLASYPETAGTPVGYYREIVDDWYVSQAEQMTFPHGLRSTKEPLIPRVIHYCWFGGAPIPKEFQRYIDGWHRMCPEYEIRRWDESNYDVTKHPYMKAAYEAGKWGFVPDYARLDIVYEHGGFYFDTDVELVRNLDELRYNKGVMAMDPSHRVSLGLGFGAMPHHPMLKALRDDYDACQFVDFHTRAERKTKAIKVGPDLQTMVFERYGFVRDCFRMQDIQDVRIYPIPVLCGQIGDRRIVTEHTYAVHHYAGTWVPDA